jgi:hypothetical protein
MLICCVWRDASVSGWAQAHEVPVIDCGREERKHLIAEEHLKKNPCIRGLFLILVGEQSPRCGT